MKRKKSKECTAQSFAKTDLKTERIQNYVERQNIHNDYANAESRNCSFLLCCLFRESCSSAALLGEIPLHVIFIVLHARIDTLLKSINMSTYFSCAV